MFLFFKSEYISYTFHFQEYKRCSKFSPMDSWREADARRTLPGNRRQSSDIMVNVLLRKTSTTTGRPVHFHIRTTSLHSLEKHGNAARNYWLNVKICLHTICLCKTFCLDYFWGPYTIPSPSPQSSMALLNLEWFLLSVTSRFTVQWIPAQRKMT